MAKGSKKKMMPMKKGAGKMPMKTDKAPKSGKSGMMKRLADKEL